MTEPNVPQTSCIYSRHKFKNVELQRKIVDFGRCFLAGSISRGSMRKSTSIQKLEALCWILYQFSKCTHLNSSYVHCTACLSCSKDLSNIAVRAGEEVNSVSQLCLYIAEAVLLGSREPLKNLAAEIAAVLAQTVKTRRRLFER